MESNDLGASANADRAGALRAEPPAESQAEPLIPCAVRLTLEWREDGGLRVCSPDVPNLLLSHKNPGLVILDVLPALAVMGFVPPRIGDER